MPTRLAIFVPLAIALVTADARGQAPGQASPRGPEKPAETRSPLLAASLSAGLPLAGLGIAVAAQDGGGWAVGGLLMFVGPSVGEWYAGGSAAVGLLGRTAGGLVMLVGLEESMEPIGDCDPDADPGCQDWEERDAAHDREVKAFLITGAAIWTAATVYDVVMAYREAGRFNREHAITVAPVMVPGAGGASAAPGLGIAGRF